MKTSEEKTPICIIKKNETGKNLFRIGLHKVPHWDNWRRYFLLALRDCGVHPNSFNDILISDKQLRGMLSKMKDHYLIATFDRPSTNFVKKTLDSFKVGIEYVREAITEIEEFSGAKYRKYQKVGSLWLFRRDNSLLADDTGLGKTLQILTAILAKEKASNFSAPVLVCSSLIATGTWVEEAEKWLGREVWVVDKKKNFRFPKPGEIIYCSWGRMPGHREFSAIPKMRTILVGDEIHACKNPKSKRSKSWNTMKSMVMGSEGTIIGSSATPMENHPGDFWHTMDACGVADKCFSNFKLYKDLFGAKQSQYGTNWGDGLVNTNVRQLIKPYVLRRKKREVRHDLPTIMPPRHIPIEIDPKDEAWEAMEEISQYIKDHKLTIEKFITLVQKKQIDFTSISKIRKVCALAKIPAMIEYVEEMEAVGETLIVMCCHRAPIEALAKREGWGMIVGGITQKQRDKVKEAFQAGELKGVGCTIRSASESVTLTAASRMLYVDQDWNPGKNIQSAGRNDRFGQTSDKLFYDFLEIKNSIDSQVQRALVKKAKWIEGTL